MGKFVISKRTNGEFQFNLKAGNGEVILSSEGYTTRAACDDGVESVRKNAQDDARFEKKEATNGKFYFNLKDNPALNAKGEAKGYTVFGRVITGMDVVEKISQEPTGMFKSFPEAPNYAVRILKAYRVSAGTVTPKTETKNPLENSRIKDALLKK